MNNIKLDKYTHIGNRNTNDDYIVYINRKDYILYMIIDGHGGSECSKIFINLFGKKFNPRRGEDIGGYIINLFIYINKIILRNKIESGLCVSGVYINGNITVVFQLGDTKIYLYNGDELIYETIQHDLNNIQERNRCLKYLKYVDVLRLHGKLTITRAIGNYGINVNCIPNIYYISSNKYNKIILCTDGVYKKTNIDINKSAKENINKCLKYPPNDNMTIMIIKLSNILNLINKSI
ncbi:protein phosphatase 2C [Mythimna separata entomopoxvirus 'L']|uniref:Protein phosphatase 2C n=1 Tax=Mythimna separata entomopoxvirus 'L' TaxID=1293572 RepID=A0A916KQD9_9POXV|nr:protein phosphatase 2C [Mythimna separata entomopoxvirus 'L']CCU56458.1 protein phosphatase 2C [Mythimna separata entomopoxvirus 'L']